MLLILVMYKYEYQIFHERRRSVFTQVTGLFYFNENTNMTWHHYLHHHYLQSLFTTLFSMLRMDYVKAYLLR